MLVEIQSDAFKGKKIQNGKITFYKGLNSVVTSESANNSTGKSSFLLAIDFAFGGKAYAEDEAKIIANVGHHTVNFAFEFNGKKSYYSRSTSDLNKVQVCNSDYSAINTISLVEFEKRISEQYGFEDKSLTLRGAVSPYFRISHKSPKTLSNFLKGSEKQDDRSSVVNFEKLFNSFDRIKEADKKAEMARKSAEVFSEAVKRNYIPAGIKDDSELEKISEKAEMIKKELAELSRTADKDIFSLDAKNSEKLKLLEQKYRKASGRKTRLENKIAVAEESLEGLNAPTKEELAVLQSFFPGLNIKKVYAVEQFHESLVAVLKSQITDEIQNLKMQFNQAELDFEAVKSQYENALPDGGFSKAAFESYGEKYLELQDLYNRMENYRKSKMIKAESEEAKSALNQKEIDVLNSIADKVNDCMAKLNALVNNGEWKNPVLEFMLPKTRTAKGISVYSLASGNDAGDGTENANVIMFDLSVLKMTRLPAIVHDLFVRSELDEKRNEDCIKLYAAKTEKQIFTVFRSIQNYSEEVQNIIKSNRVLELSVGGGELYGTRKWVKSKED